MSDTKDAQDKTTGRRPLTVSRKSDSGTVKQSFSHGRSKQVVVEKKKKRVVVTPGKSARPQASGAPSKVSEAARKAGLSEEELRARQAALAQRRADEAKRKAAAEAQEAAAKRREEEAKRLATEEKARSDAEDQRRREEEEQAQAKAAESQAEKPAEARRDAPADRGRPDRGRGRGPAPEPIAPPEPDMLSELGGRVKKARPDSGPASDNRPAARPRSEPKRRQGKLTIAAALGDDDERQRSLASVKRARERERERRSKSGQQAEKTSREVIVPEAITVQDLANRMTERVADVIKFMMQQGEMVRGADTLDADTAELIVEEFGHTIKRVSEADVEIGLDGPEDDPKDLKPRPPVVTIMGHVDHGKTSLLDALRETDVVAGEAGGITQHIGAYQIKLKSGAQITFLDTPGHAAFSSMRARGANVTDIVILVVAADDGVMPQTIEAISHAKAAEAPIIVAVNKIDKDGVDPNKVLTELLQHDVQVEAMGGEVQSIEVSALKKKGLDALTEAISLQAELLELKANPNRAADGVVVESQVERGRGPVATVLVQRGGLKRGDIVVAGAQWGKVRALTNERGQQLKEAGPSLPVEVLGLDGAPNPGDAVVVVDTEARAREITEYRERVNRTKASAAPAARASLEQMLARLQEGGGAADAETQEAVVVVKGDVQGSVEAITQSLEKLSTEEVRARVVHGAVGGISESDVLLAKASEAPIIAFNVRANKQARDLAEKEGVEIRYYSVIYNLLDDVKATLSGMLAPEKRETFIGYAEILQVFDISKLGKVAGCKITEGVVKRGCGVRLIRDDVVIHEGELSTLKRFKDEVPEVQSGMECGMGFVGYQDLKEGDRIECFTVEEIARTLD